MTTSSRLVVLVLGSLALSPPVHGQVPDFLPEFPVSTFGASSASGVLLKEDGTFVVVWDQGRDVLGRRFDAQTTPLGDPLPLTGETAGNQFLSASPLNYCPTNPNNRGQMAVFLTKTFGLVLY